MGLGVPAEQAFEVVDTMEEQLPRLLGEPPVDTAEQAGVRGGVEPPVRRRVANPRRRPYPRRCRKYARGPLSHPMPLAGAVGGGRPRLCPRRRRESALPPSGTHGPLGQGAGDRPPAPRRRERTPMQRGDLRNPCLSQNGYGTKPPGGSISAGTVRGSWVSSWGAGEDKRSGRGRGGGAAAPGFARRPGSGLQPRRGQALTANPAADGSAVGPEMGPWAPSRGLDVTETALTGTGRAALAPHWPATGSIAARFARMGKLRGRVGCKNTAQRHIAKHDARPKAFSPEAEGLTDNPPKVPRRRV